MTNSLKVECERKKLLKEALIGKRTRVATMISRVPAFSEIILKTIPNSVEEQVQIYSVILQLLKNYSDVRITGIELRKILNMGIDSRDKGFEIMVKHNCKDCGLEKETPLRYTFVKGISYPFSRDIKQYLQGIVCEQCIEERYEETADEYSRWQDEGPKDEDQKEMDAIDKINDIAKTTDEFNDESNIDPHWRKK